MKKLLFIMLTILCLPLAAMAQGNSFDNAAVARLTEFYNRYILGSEECTAAVLKRYCTTRMVQYLRNDYDYEGDGYAVWDFRGSGKPELMEPTLKGVEPLGNNKYRVRYDNAGRTHFCDIECVMVGGKPMINYILDAIPKETNSMEGYWYNGRLCYYASLRAEAGYLFNAMSEGEEYEFALYPLGGATDDAWTVISGGHGCEMEYPKGYDVRHQRGEVVDALCVYDNKGNLTATLQRTYDEDAYDLNQEQFTTQITGVYIMMGTGKEVRIYPNMITINYDEYPFTPVMFNSIATGCIKISADEAPAGGVLKAGYYEVLPTLEGAVIYKVQFDESMVMHKRTGTVMTLKWNTGYGRFAYTSNELITTEMLRGYDKKTLRVMRNEIYARHGYRFGAADLKAYFAKQPWYKPLPAGQANSVSLSLTEQINVALIKAAEES